ncbi:hypothetical protein OH492_13300 [Vibrio chagasii]|nr:hypothetical protein [Vibrio chagasii]
MLTIRPDVCVCICEKLPISRASASSV